MTVGKDVSSLFTDVVNLMQSNSVELKKLVYLYLVSYAKTNPDTAILAVNTFRRDANDSNPLIRALAIRTMGCIRLEKITEYLCEPLRRSLNDEDPYVRKTAAVCVAKLYDINPELAHDQGFLELLRALIADPNPTVVANAVAALSEIAGSGGESGVWEITTSVLQKLLAALNECTEWGQVFILDALATYDPSDEREAESIIERVTPRLQHANSAVVMSAVRVIVRYLDLIENKDTVRSLSRKMAPPLVTLLSSEPEIQYVALRNINLIVQKRSAILSSEIKVFFCKYNDPIYVKMEKLEIMIKLASERNVEQVLLELKEYATEVDVDFVRKSVRAIGRCAIKLERSAEKCINVLLELIQTKVNYVVQEAIIVIKDIFRKYPNRYESIIATLCENLDTLDEPEAKASMIWIVGEYADRIDNADELLETFLDTFHDEPSDVQLQLLTATVKLFLKRPDVAKALMENVLSMATEHSDNPDLRDRGYIYWRLLSTDPEAAKKIVLSEKPTITDDTAQLEPSLLDQLIDNLSTLASIYHKPPEAFVTRARQPIGIKLQGDDEDDDEDNDDEEEEDAGDSKKNTAKASKSDDDERGSSAEEDDEDDKKKKKSSKGSKEVNLLDLDMGGMSVSSTPQLPLLLSSDAGKGLQVNGIMDRRGGAIYLDLQFKNIGVPTEVSRFAVQLNKNTFAIAPAQQGIQLSSPLAAGSGATGSASVPLAINPNYANKGGAPSLSIQVALKNMSTNDVLYFSFEIPFYVLFVEGGAVDPSAFQQLWGSMSMDPSQQLIADIRFSNPNDIPTKLAARNVTVIGQTSESLFIALNTTTNSQVLGELKTTQGKLLLRSQQPPVLPFVAQAIQLILSN